MKGLENLAVFWYKAGLLVFWFLISDIDGLKQQNFKIQLEHEIVEHEISHRLVDAKYSLNRDYRFLSNYLD